MRVKLVALALGLLLARFTAHARGDDAKLVAAIRNAYEANRAEMTFGEVRFTVAEGLADSAESVWKGKWGTLWSTADGLLVFDSGRARFERVHPLEGIVANREKVGETTWTSPLTESIRAVTDGQLTLSDRLFVEADGKTPMHSAQIDPGTALFTQYFVFPLDLGNPESRGPRMEQDLAPAGQGRPTWTVTGIDGNAKLRGRPVVKLTLQSGGNTREYWVDLERGAIPLLIRDGKWVEYHLDDLRKVTGRAYLPHRMTIVSANPSGMKRVTDLTVVSTDFENKPSPSSFKLDFPTKRPMVNTAAMLVYGPSDVWDLTDLPSATSPGTRKVVMAAPGAQNSPPPALPVEREAKSFWGTALLVLGGLLALAGLMLGWRFRHALPRRARTA